MSKNLNNFKRVITYYLITKQNGNDVFNQNDFENYLQQHEHGKHYSTWNDLLSNLNLLDSTQIVDKSKHITSEAYQTIQQQVDDYGYPLLYNPTALEHDVIKPLTNLSIYLIISQALK